MSQAKVWKIYPNLYLKKERTNMRWKPGTTLWLVALRYWESDEEPVECQLVVEPGVADPMYLFVLHSGYGHECYVPAERCFQSRDNAIKAAKFLTELKNLKFNDELEGVKKGIRVKRGNSTEQATVVPQWGGNMTDDFIGSIPPIKHKAGISRVGYVVYPTHHVERENYIGYSGDCVKSAEVYWDRSAAKTKADTLSELRCPMTVVEVSVQPMIAD